MGRPERTPPVHVPTEGERPSPAGGQVESSLGDAQNESLHKRGQRHRCGTLSGLFWTLLGRLAGGKVRVLNEQSVKKAWK